MNHLNEAARVGRMNLTHWSITEADVSPERRKARVVKYSEEHGGLVKVGLCLRRRGSWQRSRFNIGWGIWPPTPRGVWAETLLQEASVRFLFVHKEPDETLKSSAETLSCKFHILSPLNQKYTYTLRHPDALSSDFTKYTHKILWSKTFLNVEIFLNT